jgi:membrane protein DedA with SNARE-associated domain
MNEFVVQEAGMQPAQEETSANADPSVLRLQYTYRLVLTGILAVVGIMAIIVFLIWLGALSVAETLVLIISATGTIATLVGTAVGYLLGSMGKEKSEKRLEKNLALLIEHLQKGHELNGASIKK